MGLMEFMIVFYLYIGLVLWAGNRFKLFEGNLSRRPFGPKKKKIAVGWDGGN
jgi:hypothetical protein